MTFREFIKTKISVENRDLTTGILNDKKIPINKTTKDDECKTKISGTGEVFKELLIQYEYYRKVNSTNTNNQLYSSFKDNSGKWEFYKKNFSIDKVTLFGFENDIYKIYCKNIKSNTAILIDLKCTNDLNNLTLITIKKIPTGEYKKATTVRNAIDILENCSYNGAVKPCNLRLNEVLNFLKSKVS